MNNQKAKHTPGPWTVEVWEYAAIGNSLARKVPSVISESAKLRVVVAESDEGNENPYTIPLEEAKANAALVSAAPNMLETLEAVLDWWTHTPGFQNGEDDMPAEIFDGIRNAINKAKGY